MYLFFLSRTNPLNYKRFGFGVNRHQLLQKRVYDKQKVMWRVTTRFSLDLF